MNSGSSAGSPSFVATCPNCGKKARVNPQKTVTSRPVCPACATPLPITPPTPLNVSDASFQAKVLQSPLPVLLDCWAAWCGPCRLVAPIMDELARRYQGRAVIAKLDVDHNPQTAGRFGIQSIPTLLIFKGGEVAQRIVGAQSKQAIESALQPHL